MYILGIESSCDETSASVVKCSDGFFEIKSNNLGSQNAVCGGGRYDGLVETLGGPHTPAVGWAMGVERLNALIPKMYHKNAIYFV